jgi:hypothetical protein
MTQSTLLLFKLIRWRVAAGMGGAFFLFLYLSKPSVECDCLTLLPAAALFLTSLMGLHTFLGRTLFPVTDRQVAWIPLTVWGLVTLSGLTGLATGQGIAALAGWPFFRDGFQQDLTTLPFLPFVLFLLLILWRADRISPTSTLLIFLMFCISRSFIYWISDSLKAATSHPAKWSLIPNLLFTHPAFTTWPVWILGCLFLIWEAPQQTATLRRLEFKNESNSRPSLGFPNLQGPIRRSWATHFVDTLIPLGVALFLLKLCTLQEYHFPFEFIAFIPTFFLFLEQIWKQGRGSGRGRVRSAAISLLGMTLVGYVALRDRLGVARGAAVRCPTCHNWRMVWYRECPHCENQTSKTPDDFSREMEASRRLGTLLWPRHDPSALLFRVVLVLLVVVLSFTLRSWVR